MHERGNGAADQAAGLRRLFGVAPARLAPILIDPGSAATQVAAIARLAQACAATGERTLVIDCARTQLAASLGLRARFDLIHAVRGECLLQQARLDAGPNLGVVPAARAAQAQGAQGEFLRLLESLAHGAGEADLLFLILDPAQIAVLRDHAERGEVLVPMPRERSSWGGLIRAMAKAGDGTDIAGFRLLFPAWDAGTAARLYSELVRACGDRLGTELRFGGAVQVAHDWQRIARAIVDWNLLRLPRPQTVRTF
jgi:hypothetical protein